MSNFDEAKIRRAGDGKFANKDAQRDSQGQVDFDFDGAHGAEAKLDSYGVTHSITKGAMDGDWDVHLHNQMTGENHVFRHQKRMDAHGTPPTIDEVMDWQVAEAQQVHGDSDLHEWAEAKGYVPDDDDDYPTYYDHEEEYAETINSAQNLRRVLGDDGYEDMVGNNGIAEMPEGFPPTQTALPTMTPTEHPDDGKHEREVENLKQMYDDGDLEDKEFYGALTEQYGYEIEDDDAEFIDNDPGWRTGYYKHTITMSDPDTGATYTGDFLRGNAVPTPDEASVMSMWARDLQMYREHSWDVDSIINEYGVDPEDPAQRKSIQSLHDGVSEYKKFEAFLGDRADHYMHGIA